MSETGHIGANSYGMIPPEDPRIIGTPYSYGTLVFAGQVVNFGVVEMVGAEVIPMPEDNMVFISSDFPANGPLVPARTDLPTQSQRITNYLKEQQRQAGHTNRGTGRIALTSREVIMQEPAVRKRATAKGYEQLSLWELRGTVSLD
jgi:hypothetical protein